MLSRDQLITLVQKIKDVEGTEEELDELLETVARNVPHPTLSDLIFYSKVPKSAAEIVDEALAYQPIALPNR